MASTDDLAPKEMDKTAALGLSTLVSPENAAIDVIFVHGFNGHPERTWLHKGDVESQSEGSVEAHSVEQRLKTQKLVNSFTLSRDRKSVYWPRDLLPYTLPQARILSFGYDIHLSHRLGPSRSQMSVYDFATDFLVDLVAARQSQPDRPLLFIAHSLGGIIVKEMLWQSYSYTDNQSHLRKISESTQGVIFFGTPHSGADPRLLLKTTAEKVSRAMGFTMDEPALERLLPSSERMRQLTDEFGQVARTQGWIIQSFQEEHGIKALGGEKVVKDSSSRLFDASETVEHIANNHFDICRFSGLQDAEYRKVATALSLILRQTQEAPPSPVKTMLSNEERQAYIDSLRFNQIDNRYARITTAHPRTCGWLLKTSEYVDWLEFHAHNGCLWIKGKPGTGKSTLMKYLYAHTRRTMSAATVISFFFDGSGGSLEKSILGMYRSLLLQLFENVAGLDVILNVLPPPLLSEMGELDGRWDVGTLRSIFGAAVKRVGSSGLVCFIDALNEAREDDIRDMVRFFDKLRQDTVTSGIKFHTCFSSRHYPMISIAKCRELSLEGQGGHRQDLANYLQTELRIGTNAGSERVREELLSRSNGVFSWIVLVAQILQKEYDSGQIYAIEKWLGNRLDSLVGLPQSPLTRDGLNSNDPESALAIRRDFKDSSAAVTNAVPPSDSGYASAQQRHKWHETTTSLKEPDIGDTVDASESQVDNWEMSSRAPIAAVSDEENVDVSDDRDNETVYSPGGSVTTSHRVTYITELATDLCAVVRSKENLDSEKVLESLYVAFPRLLKAFAVRLGQEASPEHLVVMGFVTRYRSEIRDAFKEMVDAPQPKRRDDQMTSHAKVLNWHIEDPEDIPQVIEIVDEVQEPFEEPLDSAESNLPPYRQFVIETLAYKWLRARILRELTFSPVEVSVTERFGHQIYSKIKGLRPFREVSRDRPPPLCLMTFEVEWNPFSSVRELDFDEHQTIGEAFTVTGTSADAQGLSCAEYLTKIWPLSGEYTLKLIELLVDSADGSVQIGGSPDRTDLTARMIESKLVFTASGTIDAIIEIGEQLGWLGAAFHSITDEPGIAYCTPVLSDIDVSSSKSLKAAQTDRNPMSCKIDFKLEQIETAGDEQNGQCWHGLFGSQIIVGGYPISRRSVSSTGLEIPLDVMAELAGTHRITEFCGRTFLKGFSTMLMPARRQRDLIFWHVLLNADGSRISYTDPRIHELACGCSLEITFSDLEECRHIVGWCSNVQNFTGSQRANYKISPSKLRNPPPGWVWSNVTISAGKYIQANLALAISQKSKAVRLRNGADYYSRLKWLETIYVVLFDDGERHAWLVDGGSALLHLLRASFRCDADGAFKDRFLFKPTDLLECPDDLSFKGWKSSAWVLQQEENIRLKLYPQKPEVWDEVDPDKETNAVPKVKIKYALFSDRAESICESLEKIYDHLQTTEEKDGVGFKLRSSPRKHLEGFDFSEIAREQYLCRPRALILDAIGSGWVDLTRAIHAIILFGRGFGELLNPVSAGELCASWTTLPKGQDHIAVCVSDINRIMEQNNGSTDDKLWQIAGDIFWHQPEYIFGPCQCRQMIPGQHGDRVQVLVPSKLTKLYGKGCSSPESLAVDGAVIFGHSWRCPLKWGDSGAPSATDSPPAQAHHVSFGGLKSGESSTSMGQADHSETPSSVDSPAEASSRTTVTDSPDAIVAQTFPADRPLLDRTSGRVSKWLKGIRKQ